MIEIDAGLSQQVAIELQGVQLFAELVWEILNEVGSLNTLRFRSVGVKYFDREIIILPRWYLKYQLGNTVFPSKAS